MTTKENDEEGRSGQLHVHYRARIGELVAALRDTKTGLGRYSMIANDDRLPVDRISVRPLAINRPEQG